MENWIEGIMSEWGYIGIALLVALENIFPPIPSEFILTFGGFMAIRTAMTVPGVIIASTIGSVAGAICLYSIGKLVQLSTLKRLLAGKIGWILRLHPKDIDSAAVWFQKHGFVTVFLCRFIPVIRSLISIPAGIARMPFLLFIHYTALGTLIWNTVLIMLGAWAGDNWSIIVSTFDQYKYYLFVPIGIFIIYSMFRFNKRQKEI
ncbi:DedA family protein [Lysinibacillus sp. LZ02]|uniref:DedA family protein n=1 Tax=Lysinibacillus sp. LZ02 TaxID=3420668 RepID=UPI003D35AFBC